VIRKRLCPDDISPDVYQIIQETGISIEKVRNSRIITNAILDWRCGYVIKGNLVKIMQGNGIIRKRMPK
jgi:hypothetical protein